MDLTNNKYLQDLVSSPLFELSPEAVVVIDKKGFFVASNGRLKEWVGYEPSDFEGKHLSTFPWFTLRSKAVVAAKFARRMLGEKVAPYALEFKAKNGEIRVGLVSGSRILDSDGNSIGDIVMISDITETEDFTTLLDKKVKFRTVIDQLIEGVQIVDRDFRYIYLNDSVLAHARKTREELMGKTMVEVYPGIDKTEMFTSLKECMESKVKKKIENKFVYPDGSEGWFELHFEPVEEGVLILSIDLSDRKAEENVRTRLHRYAELNPQPVLAIESGGLVLTANDAAKRVFGIDSDKKSFYEVASGVEKEKVEQLFDNDAVYDIEVKVGDKVFLLTFRGVHGDSSVYVYGHDITDIRRAQNELEARNNEFERLNKLMVGRELKMVELKHQIEELKK